MWKTPTRAGLPPSAWLRGPPGGQGEEEGLCGLAQGLGEEEGEGLGEARAQHGPHHGPARKAQAVEEKPEKNST